MLVWVGKRPLTHVTAFPAQHVEQFVGGEVPTESRLYWTDWPATYQPGGLLFHGDNKEVLAHLLASGFRGKVNLIYIDPPFDSGADYVRKVSLRGATGSAKVDGENYTLGEQIQYTDIWANDNYLQFMYERLLLLKEFLAPTGSLWLHCDYRKNHQLRSLLDEVFGAEALQGEVIWKRTSARSDSHGINHIHDTLFYVARSSNAVWNQQTTPYSAEYLDRFSQTDPLTGRKFQGTDLTARGLRAGATGVEWRGFDPGSKGNHWLKTPIKLDRLDQQGLIYWPPSGGWPRLKHFLDAAEGLPLQSIWSDVFVVNSQAEERTDYPTQKPETLLNRIIVSSSNPGDIVLDCFIGSGTTAAVAQKLGRRWIGCDINKGAVQTTAKGLQAVIREQVEEWTRKKSQGTQGSLLDADPQADSQPPPAQLSFSTWRVNDYDLQIQHNEAVNLACEHIGVQRTRTDGFFDGVLGRKLVKIVPFDHPLSPADLEELRRELEGRPDEDREITVVCLGMEIAARSWVDDWNRLRKGKSAANRIHIIELRTDAQYGRFIRHEPCEARVTVERRGDRLSIAIDEFLSPAILERLRQQAGVLQPSIDDWRAMVDCVMIDTAWTGEVFNVVLADVPERKSDLVEGRYDLPAPVGETTVAVKIVDMLGEEVLVTKHV
ncbi:MAG TPA: site-specific DNA-methyltransferase [Vicinamibacterales bacterium]